jgi:hypothetical protein
MRFAPARIAARIHFRLHTPKGFTPQFGRVESKVSAQLEMGKTAPQTVLNNE